MPRLDLRLDCSYGRLYASGGDAHALRGVTGAFYNERRHAVELSLTIPRLREARAALRIDKADFARACTPAVLNWTRAAGAIETHVRRVHERINAGERQDFPWLDTTGHPVTGAYRAPYDHQKVMATVAAWCDGVYFQAEPGTGKTRAALEAAQWLVAQSRLDVVLVICPRRAASTWIDEPPTWTRGFNVVRLTSGSVRSVRAPALEHARRGDLLVLNLDVLLSADIKRAFAALSARLRVGLIIDEAHKFKNPHAARTAALMQMARTSTHRIAMSGTPVLQGIQDVWSQWYVVDFGLTFGANFVSYRRDFLVENPFDGSITAKDGALDAVGTLMRVRGLRFRKADCMDLPPKMHEKAECEMSVEQSRAYERLRDDLIAEIQGGAIVEAANQLVAMMRLTQITSGFVKTADGAILPFEQNPKLDLLEELVRENIGLSSIIVWARYRQDIEQIARRLQNLAPSILYGGMSDRESDTSVRRFQDGTTRLFISNPAAGGTSLNLQAANLACYYSQDYSLEARTQSEDRCHRGGSESHNKVTYIDLLCRDDHARVTIDHFVRNAVIDKRNVASLVTDLRQHVVLAR